MLGHADTADHRLATEQIVLGGFTPFIDYKRWYELAIDAIASIQMELAELQAGYDRRGQTIEELTQTFTEKKERIHAFYAPQLENRRQELQELESFKDVHAIEQQWRIEGEKKIARLEAELEKERTRHESQRDTIAQYQDATGTVTPVQLAPAVLPPQLVVEQRVHDSVIQEYEEQIGILAQKADNLQESFNTADKHRTVWALDNQELRLDNSNLKAYNAHLEAQLAEINEAVDLTVVLFNKTGEALNLASDAGDTE